MIVTSGFGITLELRTLTAKFDAGLRRGASGTVKLENLVFRNRGNVPPKKCAGNLNPNVSKIRDVMKSKAQTANCRERAVICATKRFAVWNAAIRACRF